ncbi:MAG TPA: bifunctional indole-3-glycerol-phosphate synthase TrpC/phosphoribosylanthranilate isomerase TrpF [Gemmatimonadales bacterium]|nr:bifunctional indole-3-glycerol-phosphate synthase TrpC/phosphoribosylanthranilate isomerase TrpF [Gemmatimonadales bacterium]
MALEEILAHKRVEVAARKRSASLESLLAGAGPGNRGFEAALRAGRPGFILEIKFASPSAGVIRSGSDLDPVLASYGRHADAVSVLTDERFFGGSLARLAQVRERIRQPLLCKDFILDPFQVAEARVHGADAILLILAAIDDAAWTACAGLAARLGMDVLTEVHDEAEVRRAVDLGARIIGINNRNLGTLAVDLDTTLRLAPLIPPGRLVVAESGITTRTDVGTLLPHADAFLVGSALMREPDLDRAVRSMVYGRTKICGLTRPEDAAAACAAGATHGGLMFVPSSTRLVTAETAEQIRAAALLEWVGVFAGQSPEVIADLAHRLELAAVQLHGKEDATEVRRVRALVPEGCEVWKAVRVRGRLPLRGETGAGRLLLDGWSPGKLGGTGAAFDWSLLASYPERHTVVLAGGLNAANVEQAAPLGTWALDLSSGVESAPGRKDPEKLRDFFSARRRLPSRSDTP